MPKGRKIERSSDMYEHIVEIRTVEECRRFFDDLCAMTELRAMEQRFEVAKMLHSGKVYTTILNETGASSATVSRVNRALNYNTGGMKEIIERMEEKRGEGAEGSEEIRRAE